MEGMEEVVVVFVVVVVSVEYVNWRATVGDFIIARGFIGALSSRRIEIDWVMGDEEIVFEVGGNVVVEGVVVKVGAVEFIGFLKDTILKIISSLL